MPDNLIADQFRKKMNKSKMTGIGICGSPYEMVITLDYTGPRGSGSGIYYSYIFQLPKWDYNVIKVDEWIEVTPEWAEFHSITIGQKQKMMETIKAGLTSAGAAVTDYELLSHDLRRYREMLDYFKKGVKDEHVIRSLFVDRVDAHTGEGFSLISMARRWPTVITDFIRMKSEWTDPDVIKDERQQLLKIKTELDVSQAEATILKTKNELFREWKKLFLPTVKERYARIDNMTRARKTSIDEYKKWLKPYIAKLKMMREKTEVKPAEFISSPYMVPGFGQSQAFTGVKLWIWKYLLPAELRKTERGPYKNFRFTNTKGEKDSYSCIVDPYDDLVIEWKKKIEEKYDVPLPEAKIREVIKESFVNKRMYPDMLYYVFFEANIELSLSKTPPPEGVELDDLMFKPLMGFFMSQNVILIHILEIVAREMALEKHVDDMIGAPSREEKTLEEVEKEFSELVNPPKPVRFTGLKAFTERMRGGHARGRTYGRKFFYIFVRRGPYETVFFDRITKMFARGMGGFYGQQLDFLKKKMGVW